MIPLKDTIPSRHWPVMNWFLILANIAIFLYQQKLLTINPGEFRAFISQFGLIPATFATSGPALLKSMLQLGTYQFLHGGWMHLISNMWALWLFGDNVEDRMGPVKYLFFYLFVGILAGLVHLYTNQNSSVPTIGASGAIAGVMGAYFVLYPSARIVTLIPLFFIPFFLEIPAMVYLAFWLITQIYSVLVNQYNAATSNIAWWAHIGGFVSGACFHRLFFRRKHLDYHINRL